MEITFAVKDVEAFQINSKLDNHILLVIMVLVIKITSSTSELNGLLLSGAQSVYYIMVIFVIKRGYRVFVPWMIRRYRRVKGQLTPTGIATATATTSQQQRRLTLRCSRCVNGVSFVVVRAIRRPLINKQISNNRTC